MQADSGRKYRLYPTDEQAARLVSWGHTCRWLYNVALEQRQFAWRQRGTTFGVTRQCVELTAVRRDLDWVADLPAQAGQQVLRHLDQAHRNWWNPAHPAGPLTWKRRSSRLAVPLPGQAVAVRRLNRRWGEVMIPKLGPVKFRWSRALGGTVRNCVISRDGSGWHVSFGVHTGQKTPTAHNRPESTVGVDRGITVALALSDGRMWGRTFATSGQEQHLARLRSKAGRQETVRRNTSAKTSKRTLRVRAAIARAMARQRQRRTDFAHWSANRICAQHALVGIEALNIGNMTATAKGTVENPGRNIAAKAGLNRVILDKGWGRFEQALTNQARKTGTTIVKVNPAYTSQQCSNPICRNTSSENRKSQAVFKCVACGYTCNADVNAANNIRDTAEAVSGHTGRAARDADLRVPRQPPNRSQPTAATTGIAFRQEDEDVNRRGSDLPPSCQPHDCRSRVHR